MTHASYTQPYPELLLVYGTRAEQARLHPLADAIHEHSLPIDIVSTGQHWDAALVGDGLGEGREVANLDVRSSDLGALKSSIIKFLIENPNYDGVPICSYTDTASAIATAHAAVELGRLLIHVEAGQRTYDRYGQRVKSSLLEESFRIEIDGTCDGAIPLLQIPHDNLLEEQVKAHVTGPTGHPLADAIVNDAGRYSATKDPGTGLVTIHRKANINENDDDFRLPTILDQLAIGAAANVQWIFPAHPFVKKIIHDNNLSVPKNVTIVPPMRHDEILDVLACAEHVVTDSAGISVEAPLAGCNTVVCRDETEFPESLLCSQLVRVDDISAALGSPLPDRKRNLPELRNIFSKGDSISALIQAMRDVAMAIKE